MLGLKESVQSWVSVIGQRVWWGQCRGLVRSLQSARPVCSDSFLWLFLFGDKNAPLLHVWGKPLSQEGLIVAGGNEALSQSHNKIISGDPYIEGGWDVLVRFIGIEMEGRAQVPGVSSPPIPPWKKSSLVFIRPSVQKLCAMPKLSPVQPLSPSS